mmetsp:Transcript_33131/g.60062  ORF Transcript_33131/g.60062 Transcript_33131/m.60062 type:complete len:111 (-) Transcript_33131:22-354(-)
MEGRRCSRCLSLAFAALLVYVFTWSSSFITPGQMHGHGVKTGSNLLAGQASLQASAPTELLAEKTPTSPTEDEGPPWLYIVLVVDVLIFAADRAGLVEVPVLHEYWQKMA